MRELLIAISKMDELQFLFLRHLLFSSNSEGRCIFDTPSNIFDPKKETPDYAIRRVGAEIFKHPLSFNTHTNSIHLRVLSNQSKDATRPYEVQLAREVFDKKSVLCEYFNNGVLTDLRCLKRDTSKLLYLKLKGRVEFSESEVRNLLEDDFDGRFSNIVERKLKPSLIEINKTLKLPTHYSTKRINGVATITIEINNTNSRFMHYESV